MNCQVLRQLVNFALLVVNAVAVKEGRMLFNVTLQANFKSFSQMIDRVVIVINVA
jgi:hypothetical protein